MLRFSKGATIFYLLLVLSGLFATNRLDAQVVWENQNSEIYNYLYRMAQKGLIRFDDQVRPLSRIYLESCLDSLQAKSSALTGKEKKELAFYQKEFSDKKAMNYTDSNVSSKFFRKDEYGRWRAVTFTAKDFVLRIDPVISAATIQGNGKNIMQTSAGFNAHGYAGKHWGFYLSFNDVTESGTGIDTLKQFTPVTGTVGKIASNGKSYNYSELRGGISYGWKNGSISLVQDQLLNGYGENGRIILSSKAPTYPYLRLDYTPFTWFSFNYTHAWLNSNILDSGRTYSTGGGPVFGGQRNFYIRKYMAQHSLRFTPLKGLDITVGESMVYSDNLEIGYFIPILFFKAYDNLRNNNNINANSNSQLFLQLSSKNNIPNTHLYGSLFIDEIRASTVFSPNSRNQLGFNLGGSITDVVIPYLTLGLEYTRINPFVYRNLLPAQNYTNSDYLLGDWMGNNSDRWIATVKYTPVPKLKCMLRYQSLRKGSPGTLDQQYFQEPQPPFLFGLLTTQQEWHFQCSYEWLNKIYLTGYYNSLHINNVVAGTKNTENSFSLGISYGL